jgi:hypothetical protein
MNTWEFHLDEAAMTWLLELKNWWLKQGDRSMISFVDTIQIESSFPTTPQTL